MTTSASEINYWGRLIEPEIKEFLQAKDFKSLRSALAELEAPDIAEALLVLTPDERAIVFRILPRQLGAEVFAYLPFAEEEELIHSLGNEHVTGILNEMEPDDRTALLEELPGQITKRLIASLSPEERSVARQLLGYPEESVGRLMTPEYVSINEEWTVQETLNKLRQIGKEKETVNSLYVTDQKDHLLAYVPLKMLIFVAPDSLVRDIMLPNIVALRAFDDQETASDAMLHYDLNILPVIDSDGTLVGIVTADDVLDVVIEETTEDIHLMGGVQALEEPYDDVSFFTMARKRGTWLFILFLGSTITVAIMKQFETTIDNVSTAVVLFLPMIISSGGNSGSQAATLIIRALSVQDVELKDWLVVFGRELLTGLLLGAFLGIIAMLLVVLWPGAETLFGANYIMFGFTISCAVVGVVTAGAVIGSMLPFLLSAWGVDPALASTPLVATLVDALGVVILFSAALLILA
ncbi:MAG: magnesium transporter [Candidatus Hinthialibacter antarcticus]|nr:magnesium transporter [Candidatus Hinthialibacter antarcticus]